MKLFNPSKPHIVYNGKNYAIRKLELFGWSYLDRDILCNHWWALESYVYTYAMLGSLEEAEERLRLLKLGKPSKFVRIK